MRSLAVVLAFVLAGCLEHALVRCGDQLCPAGTTCTPGGCARPEQVAACADAADGDACVTRAIASGTCWGGACRAAVCGNGVIDAEAGEVCDDGNVAYGDGCAGDCRSNETCGNNVVDRAVGEECDDGNLDDNDACRANCVVPRCGDGTVDAQNGEACDEGLANSNAPGSACRTNCQAQRCGDGVLDPGENCDDGNLTSGDGCSGDCVSLEVCGNGYIDVVAGEQCDDTHAAGLAGDGCTSTCTLEIDLWRHTPSLPPGHRYRAAMVYDSARRRIVLFGGYHENEGLRDTWEYDGVAWRLARSEQSPPAAKILGHRMVYDAHRGVTVLVTDDATETWEWDGVTWTRHAPSTSPPSRFQFALAYHSAQQRVVLFGGSTGQKRDDTWLWDGVTWTAASPATKPPPLDDGALGDDPLRGRLVLYDGEGPRNEIWEWTGTNWERVALSALGPSALFGGYILHDGTQLHFFVHGAPNKQYVYTDSQWQLVSPAGAPELSFPGLAFDSHRNIFFAFAGSAINGHPQDLWAYQFGYWRIFTALTEPAAVVGAAFVYDSRRGRIVSAAGGIGIFFASGHGPHTYNRDETWIFDHDRWTRLEATPAPKLVYVHATYDAHRDRVVLFGGLREDASISNETWELDGTTWTQRAPATSPPGSSWQSLVFDVRRGKSLLFEPQNLGQVWEWDGTTWTPRSAIAAPPVRMRGSLTYDVHRDRVVLFGGIVDPTGTATVVDETWEYDGTTWTQQFPTNTPGARYAASLAYDPYRREVLLFGGADDEFLFGPPVADAAPWSYDGKRWKRIATPFGPPARFSAAAAFDAEARAFVIQAGMDGSVQAPVGTWQLSLGSSSSPAETCESSTLDSDGDGLAGCADPDCWARCTPLCPPDMTGCETTWPRCGDDTCDPLEDAQLCPADCS